MRFVRLIAVAVMVLMIGGSLRAQQANSITLVNPAANSKVQQTFFVEGCFTAVKGGAKIVCEVWDLGVNPPVRSGPQTYAAVNYDTGTYIGILSSWPGANFGVGVYIEGTTAAASNLGITIIGSAQPPGGPPAKMDDEDDPLACRGERLRNLFYIPFRPFRHNC